MRIPAVMRNFGCTSRVAAAAAAARACNGVCNVVGPSYRCRVSNTRLVGRDNFPADKLHFALIVHLNTGKKAGREKRRGDETSRAFLVSHRDCR